mgnify:CR=1 FL=1
MRTVMQENTGLVKRSCVETAKPEKMRSRGHAWKRAGRNTVWKYNWKYRERREPEWMK